MLMIGNILRGVRLMIRSILPAAAVAAVLVVMSPTAAPAAVSVMMSPAAAAAVVLVVMSDKYHDDVIDLLDDNLVSYLTPQNTDIDDDDYVDIDSDTDGKA